MTLEVTGKLIAKYDTQQVSERFKKREFVIELADEINGNLYTNYAKMQLAQNKCEIIDRFNLGDVVKVNFNIKGNKWEKDGEVKYITNLDAWRVEKTDAAPNNNAGAQQAGTAYNKENNTTAFAGTNNYNPSPETADDLPF